MIDEEHYRDKAVRCLKKYWGEDYAKEVRRTAEVCRRLCHNGDTENLLSVVTNGHFLGDDIDFLKACARLRGKYFPHSMPAEEIYRRLAKKFRGRPEII